MNKITYKHGEEIKCILVDADVRAQHSADELIHLLHPLTKHSLVVMDNTYVGLTYSIPVIQPIGNMNGIG